MDGDADGADGGAQSKQARTTLTIARLPETLLMEVIAPLSGYRAIRTLDVALGGKYSRTAVAELRASWERSLEEARRVAFGRSRREALDADSSLEIDQVRTAALVNCLYESRLRYSFSVDGEGNAATHLARLGRMLAAGTRGDAGTVLRAAMGVRIAAGFHGSKSQSTYRMSYAGLGLVLDGGLDPNATFEFGNDLNGSYNRSHYHCDLFERATALYVAAKRKDPKAAKLLLAAGALVDTAASGHFKKSYSACRGDVTTLYAAVIAQDVDTVRVLLAASRDPHKLLMDPLLETSIQPVQYGPYSGSIPPPTEVSTLAAALQRGSLDIVRCLLEVGEDAASTKINYTYKAPYIPNRVADASLLHVCWRRYGPLLVSAGADAKCTLESGRTPLHTAVKDYGADMRREDAFGSHYPFERDTRAERPDLPQFRREQLAFIDALLANGASPNAKETAPSFRRRSAYDSPSGGESYEGNTPLHEALAVGHRVSDHSDEHHEDLTSIITSRAAIVEKLLAAGGDLNLKNAEGVTPFNLAVVWMDLPRIRTLLAAGAKVTVKDKWGHSSLSFAVINPFYRYARYALSPRGIRMLQNKKDVISALLETGVNPLLKSKTSGATPLLEALLEESYRTPMPPAFITEALVPVSNLGARLKSGESVLHLSAGWASADFLKLLVETAAKNSKGPAAIKGHKPLSVNWKGGDTDETAIMILLQHVTKDNKDCMLESLEYLLKNGAKTNFRNVQGHTALHFANIANHGGGFYENPFNDLVRAHGGGL